MKKYLFILIAITASLNCFSQGSLMFSEVVLITSSNGTVTVPSGEVWKITKIIGNPTHHIVSSTTSPSWNATQTNPHPCTGATSGSYTATNIMRGSCYDYEKVFINGKRTNIKNSGSYLDNVVWLPAGTTLYVTSTTCTGSAVNVATDDIYYFDNNGSIPHCGPFSLAASITYSPMVSIIKFKIVP